MKNLDSKSEKPRDSSVIPIAIASPDLSSSGQENLKQLTAYHHPSDLLVNALGSNKAFIFHHGIPVEPGSKKFVEQIRDVAGRTILTVKEMDPSSTDQNGAAGGLIFTDSFNRTVLTALLKGTTFTLYSGDSLLGMAMAEFGMYGTCDVRARDEDGQPLLKVVQGKGMLTQGADHFIVHEGHGGQMGRVNYYMVKKLVKISIADHLDVQIKGLVLLMGHLLFAQYFKWQNPSGGLCTIL